MIEVASPFFSTVLTFTPFLLPIFLDLFKMFSDSSWYFKIIAFNAFCDPTWAKGRFYIACRAVVWASVFFDKKIAWFRALNELSEPSIGTNSFENISLTIMSSFYYIYSNNHCPVFSTKIHINGDVVSNIIINNCKICMMDVCYYFIMVIRIYFYYFMIQEDLL